MLEGEDLAEGIALSKGLHVDFADGADGTGYDVGRVAGEVEVAKLEGQPDAAEVDAIVEEAGASRQWSEGLGHGEAELVYAGKGLGGQQEEAQVVGRVRAAHDDGGVPQEHGQRLEEEGVVDMAHGGQPFALAALEDVGSLAVAMLGLGADESEGGEGKDFLAELERETEKRIAGGDGVCVAVDVGWLGSRHGCG